MHTNLLPAALALAVLPTVLTAQAASAPCFEPNLGTQIGAADDLVFPAVTFGFPFPYAGNNYTQGEVSSNGFMWLGANSNTNSRCCAGTGAQFCTDPASVAALWTDLVTDNVNGSGVYFNALPARVVITWYNAHEFGGTARFTIQLQLTILGEVTYWYSPGTMITQTYHTMVAGITPGNNATNPGSIDLSASFPFTSTQPTVYEEWAGNAFDLAQHTFELIPTGPSSFLGLDRPACVFTPGSFQAYGSGCPPLQAIEMIPVGNGYAVHQTSSTGWFAGFTNATNIGDDQTIAVTLPFSFPNPAGATSTVGLCSNGYIHLSNSPLATYVPTVADFLSGPPRIFGCMTDWYQPGTGQVYSDQMSPTSWAFTWDHVAEFANGTPGGTWQMQLDATGRVVLLYGAMNVVSHNILVGFSRGNGVADPGNTDLSVAMPFATGVNPEFYQLFQPGSAFDLVSPTVPLGLTQDTGNPVIGTTYRLRVESQPANALATFLVLGFHQVAAGTPLDGIGMTNCRQWVTLDSSLFFPSTQPSTICPLSLPNNTALIGYSVFAQAADVAPGVNPLGIAASNGVRITLGTF